ncbi:glycosyltransferase family 2 protein [Sphingomonas gei]|uniref:Glycosyltransferase family 2 protein n=2 Tax=Sphingomonas gei TaxID=1395960 RepID=A0A4S1XCE4_9SPHN|nr:glycosyltransferase family 2 protein [Sphingomonas gei]
MLGAWRIRLWLKRRQRARLDRAAHAAVAAFPTIAQRRPHGLATPLIVNLTSYPARYPTLAPTLRSLLDQSLAADRTILWLAHQDVEVLPDAVRQLESHGLEVRSCDDLRSYKKLIPALTQWPEAIHVTADDDVYYPPDWLAGLVGAHDPLRPSVIGWRAHLARASASGVLPYREWEMATARTEAEPGTALFPTGIGGVLYPPGSLHPDVRDRAQFTALCPQGDDIWFYWMARRQGMRHRRVDGWIDFIEWPASQQAGLRVDNIERDGNDRQIQAMEAVYGPFPL